MIVYVRNKDGKPLMPTRRCGHVRKLLRDGEAFVYSRKPFTIQLTYETEDIVQPLCVGIDPGRTNIGIAVVKENGQPVMAVQVTTRNKDIPKLLEERKAHRNQHRDQGSKGRENGKPAYYIDTDGNKHRANKCTTIKQNTGLVFL